MADNAETNALADKVFKREHPVDPHEQIRLLAEIAPHAEKLGKLAFEERDKTAWTRVQDGIFDLPSFSVSSGKKSESRRRTFLRGDLLASGICEIIWKIEEENLPRLEPEEPLVGEKAAEYCEAEFRKRSVFHHPMFEYIATADLNEAQVKAAALAYLNSVMVRIRTVHRSIMLVQLPMDFHDCIKLAPLVVDELGAGKLEDAHAQKTAADIEKWGGTVDWHAPVDSTEMKAMLNWNLRTVTHPDSLWSYCGIFCVEWNSYLELRAALLALRKRGVDDYMLDVLVQHGDGDPYDQDGHALLVRQELGRRIKTPEDTALILTGLAYHQGLYHAFHELEYQKLRAQVEAAG